MPGTASWGRLSAGLRSQYSADGHAYKRCDGQDDSEGEVWVVCYSFSEDGENQDTKWNRQDDVGSKCTKDHAGKGVDEGATQPVTHEPGESSHDGHRRDQEFPRPWGP